MEHGLLNSNKLVSIVVTCYNHELFIEECIDSIFDQDYKNIELIVFNDGSTDKSDFIIRKKLESSPFENTKYIYHDNKGLVLTKNLAFDYINGDYFVFIDSDDKIESKFISRQIEIAETKKADLVYTPLKDLATGEIVLPIRKYSLSTLFIGNYIHASSLLRTSMVKSARFDEKLNRKKLEDYDFYLKLLTSQEMTVVPCGDVFLNYRRNHDSRSEHNDLKAYYDVYEYIISKYLTSYPAYVSKALSYHFDQLTNLDIEHSIKQEYIEVFMSETDMYSESPNYRTKIKFKDSFEIRVHKGIKSIRIKPSNIPSFYKSFNVKRSYFNTEILPYKSNGIFSEDMLIFEDFYPFVDYKINLDRDESIIVSYERFNISDITAKDYIGKILINQKYNLNNTINSLELKNISLNNDLINQKVKLKELESQYNGLKIKYKKILNSRTWRLRDRLLSFFRRNK